MDDKLDYTKLKGLCIKCMRRKFCPQARKYLDMIECSAFKVHGSRLTRYKDKNQELLNKDKN